MLEKSRFMSYLFIASAAALAVASSAAAASLDQVKKAGLLRVAVTQDDAPFGSIGTDMAPIGLDIELATAVAQKLGVKVEFTPVSIQNRIPFLQTGKVDIIIADLGKTPEREKQIDYVKQPYALTFNGVFGDAKISVKKPADLSGHTISSTRGSTEDLQLTEAAPKDANIKRFEDVNGTLSAYSSGQVELFVQGSATAAAFAKASPRPFDIKYHMDDEPDFIAVSKGADDLRSAVDAIIVDLKKDGTLNALSQKWLGNPLPQDF